MRNLLRNEVPQEFFREYMDTKASKMLDSEVLAKIDGRIQHWPGRHQNVMVWWVLANGYAVGWNENTSIGWSFPVVKIDIKEEVKKVWSKAHEERQQTNGNKTYWLIRNGNDTMYIASGDTKKEAWLKSFEYAIKKLATPVGEGGNLVTTIVRDVQTLSHKA